MQLEDKAGYQEETHKSTYANSMEGRRIHRQDSEFVVPCANHVRRFWERFRIFIAIFPWALFLAQYPQAI